jgi:ribosomal protein L10
VDKSKRRKKSLEKQIKEEKEALAVDNARAGVLADVVKDQKLAKAETVDKSKLPSKDELKAQIKSEKQDQQREAAHNQMLENISEGDYRLKHTETVDKSLAKKSKKELRELIKNEKDAYKAQEKEDRSKVLGDVTKDQKLKKTETVDKYKLPDKDELKNQIKSEKQGQAIDDAHTKVIADVSKKEKKLKKAETNDKSKLADKAELNAQIKSEKQAKKRDDAHTKIVGDISEGDYALKKASTNDKSKLPSKEEMQAQIKAEKEAPADES